MKKLSTILFLCSFSFYTFSQITIVESDVAGDNDEILISNGNILTTFDATETGPSFNWDYSNLSFTTQDTDIWVASTETDITYFLLWFSSDVANKSGQDIDLTLFTLTDIFNFYDRSSSQLAITGTASSVSGIPLPASFDGDDVIYKFPMTYGDVNSSTSSYSITIPTIGGYSETRNRTNTIDGWGTLTTPYGTFDVLRQKSELAVDDIISSDFGDIPISYATNEYKWMGKTQDIPLLTITTQTVFGFEAVTRVVYRDSLREIVDPIDTLSAFASIIIPSVGVQIYPNPVTTNLTINFTSNNSNLISVAIVDILGNNVSNLYQFNTFQGSNIETISISDLHLAKGIYGLKYQVDGKQIGVKSFIVGN